MPQATDEDIRKMDAAAIAIHEYFGLRLEATPSRSCNREYSLLSPTNRKLMTIHLRISNGRVRFRSMGYVLTDDQESDIKRIIRDSDCPWEYYPNYFSLYDNHAKFAEANKALCDIASKVWSAIKNGDGQVIPALQQDWKAAINKYIHVGASDTEPLEIMGNLVIQAGKRGHWSEEKLEKWASEFRWVNLI